MGWIMGRELNKKELKNTRLANNYGGWIYCESCNENIGYLCYTTYDKFKLEYECNCGSKGQAILEFVDNNNENTGNDLIIIKNRYCCADDKSPLVTILDKKLKKYSFEIVCANCKKIYKKKREE